MAAYTREGIRWHPKHRHTRKGRIHDSLAHPEGAQSAWAVGRSEPFGPIPYLLIDTGGWLTGRDVFITPHAVQAVDMGAHTVTVGLTREKVQRSPQLEPEYYRYYGYREHRQAADDHLRSCSEVTGYHIQATDDGIGHVEDFLFDDETWAIRYLIVATRNWLPGRHVLVPSQSIGEVDWTLGAVRINLSCNQIRQSAEFDPEHLPLGDYEQTLQGTRSPL